MKVLITLAVIAVALSAVLLERSQRPGVSLGSMSTFERSSGAGGGGW